jgi:hypothetical protein
LITALRGDASLLPLDDILTHEPHPRNQRLYEAVKRIGLVEQSGRGVDKVYLGQLRYGRPAPDYLRSDTTGVRLTLRGGSESLKFAAFVFDRERSRGSMAVDELITLNLLFQNRRVTSDECATAIQRPVAEARAVLERLVEEGLIEAKGERRGRVYHFSAKVYRHLGKPEDHTRVHGLDPIRRMNHHVNAIAGRLSLRPPQRRSLVILDRITEIVPPQKGADLAAALEVIRSEFPTVTDFEREFPSLCFALATGVGKTRLMGAFISYLHLAHGINNFFVMAPNLTIYNKLITDFTPNLP